MLGKSLGGFFQRSRGSSRDRLGANEYDQPPDERNPNHALGEIVLPVVPRFYLKLNRDWQDTVLELPPGDWRDEFSGELFRGVVRMDNLLGKFPVALLVRV